MRTVERQFEVGGLVYLFRATTCGPVTFHITSGGTDKKAFRSDWTDPEFEGGMADGNYLRSAFPVFRVVQKLLLEWVFTAKPYLFSITPSTERKLPMYRWMAKRLADKLRDHYCMCESDETFWFIRTEAGL